ncbi:hypothetical protein AVEN_136474-1 [Araneus ventricosus]|uniref:Uncharacterized protein n=1 Tax=Araneus ventricosus TaxID=182803 RepID=A0A4Y2R2Y6_ARAVE|nr:hypothetical protein AVEN_136474-1 [Araneus ventricosus]
MGMRTGHISKQGLASWWDIVLVGVELSLADDGPDSKEGCHFTFHMLSTKAFPRKSFRKPLPQGLHTKAFDELPHRQAPSGIVVIAFAFQLYEREGM